MVGAERLFIAPLTPLSKSAVERELKLFSIVFERFSFEGSLEAKVNDVGIAADARRKTDLVSRNLSAYERALEIEKWNFVFLTRD